MKNVIAAALAALISFPAFAADTCMTRVDMIVEMRSKHFSHERVLFKDDEMVKVRTITGTSASPEVSDVWYDGGDSYVLTSYAGTHKRFCVVTVNEIKVDTFDLAFGE